MIDKLVKEMEALDEVEALCLGGSRATGTHDKNSDYDLYVYLEKDLSEAKRRNILDKYVKYMEYSNEFWELEDDGILSNGIDIEFIYRSTNWLEEMLDNGLVKQYVSHGYSTCFVDNLLNCKVLFDKKGNIERLREKYSKLLTDDLYSKIITYNYPILLDKMPSLYYQIEKAMKRNDVVSIVHRTTAFFEMYFDIIFAINKKTHPGEKRLLEIASNLGKTPIDMKNQIEEYYSLINVDNDKSLIVLEDIVINLHNLLKKEGFAFNHRSYK